MYDYSCTIRRVVDGDTVDVDVDLGWDTWKHNKRIRLFAVDTPECRTRDKQEKAAGLLAKKFVQERLEVGKKYALKTHEKGKYGRYLGTIFLEDGTSINAALVSERLAVPYSGQNKELVEAAHKKNYEYLVKNKAL